MDPGLAYKGVLDFLQVSCKLADTAQSGLIEIRLPPRLYAHFLLAIGPGGAWILSNISCRWNNTLVCADNRVDTPIGRNDRNEIYIL